MAFISPGKIRKQNKEIAKLINGLFDEFGRHDCYVIFTTYIGTLYKFVACDSTKPLKEVQLRLEYDPFEVKWASSQKALKKMTDVSVIRKGPVGYEFVP